METDRIQIQRNEFEALAELTRSFQSLPAVVDDDYPSARRRYEADLRTFLKACKENGRCVG